MKPSQNYVDALVKTFGEERTQVMVKAFESEVELRLQGADQSTTNFAFIVFCHGFTKGAEEALRTFAKGLVV